MVGTGPSLQQQLPLLKHLSNEDTFGCNSLILWKDLPFRPTFYGYGESPWHTIERLSALVSNSTNFQFHVWPYEMQQLPRSVTWVNVVSRRTSITEHGFVGLNDKFAPLHFGYTSPLTLAQIAAWIGYQEIYFLGIDLTAVGQLYDPSFDRVGRASQSVILHNFERATADMKACGRSMYDCTPNGPLSSNGILEHVELSTLFEGE